VPRKPKFRAAGRTENPPAHFGGQEVVQESSPDTTTDPISDPAVTTGLATEYTPDVDNSEPTTDAQALEYEPFASVAIIAPRYEALTSDSLVYAASAVVVDELRDGVRTRRLYEGRPDRRAFKYALSQSKGEGVVIEGGDAIAALYR